MSNPTQTVRAIRPGLVALVAEGDASGNGIVRRVLGSLGIRRVVEARDGAEVLGAFAERKPDLLILGWQQGVVSAAEIVACVRDAASSHAPAMPIIVTMSAPTRSAVQSALALKVDAVVAKPYSAQSLRTRLEAALTGLQPQA